MAWYNNWHDFTGDVNSIAHGHNPTNKPTPVQAGPPSGPSSLPIAGGPHTTGQQTSTDPAGQTPGANGSSMGGNTDVPTTGGSGSGYTGPGSGIVDWVFNHGGDIASALSDFAHKNGTTALEAWNLYNSAQRQGQADKYAQGALDGTNERFAAKAPLRSAGIAGMLDPSARQPNINNIRQISSAGSGNPFARALPIAGQATQFAPSPAGPPGTGTPAHPPTNDGGPDDPDPLHGKPPALPNSPLKPQPLPNSPLRPPWMPTTQTKLPIAPQQPNLPSTDDVIPKRTIPLAS